jgi:hypothetical protein
MEPDEYLADVIAAALMRQRFAPPRRRRSHWHEGYDEDRAEAQRMARAVVEALKEHRYTFSRPPPPRTPHSIP